MIPAAALAAMTQWACPALADTIYRFTDGQGDVKYSTEPPPPGVSFEVLDPVREPTPAETEAARERQRRMESFIENANPSGVRPGAAGAGEPTARAGDADAGAHWRAVREEERRRAIWGKDWPIHHPRHR